MANRYRLVFFSFCTNVTKFYKLLRLSIDLSCHCSFFWSSNCEIFFTNKVINYVFSTRDYHCYCEDGYTGDHCQTDWDECWSDPCLNGATCVDQVANYNCSCAPGFRGTQCENCANLLSQIFRKNYVKPTILVLNCSLNLALNCFHGIF